MSNSAIPQRGFEKNAVCYRRKLRCVLLVYAADENNALRQLQVQKLVNNWLVVTSFSIGVADTVADTETIMTIGGIIDTAKRCVRWWRMFDGWDAEQCRKVRRNTYVCV